MPNIVSQQILLKRYPTGAPTEQDFTCVETAISKLGDGKVLNRTIYL